MFGNSTNQENNTAKNLAARDVNDHSYTVNLAPLQKHNKLKELFKTFEYEKENNIQFREFIDELQHFTTPKIENVIGLEAKLKIANKENIIEFAKEVKEIYAKKLFKYQFFQSAQKINLYLLGLTWTYFMNSVYPLIYNGESEIVINDAVKNSIIDPLLEALDGDTLGFQPNDISGMIYFLTGNCHIKWTK